jgi:hypothetical protein
MRLFFVKAPLVRVAMDDPGCRQRCGTEHGADDDVGHRLSGPLSVSGRELLGSFLFSAF